MDEPVVANEQATIVAHLLAVGQAFRPWWAQSAVVPDQLAGRHGHAASGGAGEPLYVTIIGLGRRWACRELLGDNGAERVGLFVDARGGGLDAEGSAQFQGAEDRVHRVAADVAQLAPTTLPPTAPLEG